MELVTVVNDVGVDPNRVTDQPHTIPLLQFVCGLGPRKASALLKVSDCVPQKNFFSIIHLFKKPWMWYKIVQ